MKSEPGKPIQVITTRSKEEVTVKMNGDTLNHNFILLQIIVSEIRERFWSMPFEEVPMDERETYDDFCQFFTELDDSLFTFQGALGNIPKEVKLDWFFTNSMSAEEMAEKNK